MDDKTAILPDINIKVLKKLLRYKLSNKEINVFLLNNFFLDYIKNNNIYLRPGDHILDENFINILKVNSNRINNVSRKIFSGNIINIAGFRQLIDNIYRTINSFNLNSNPDKIINTQTNLVDKKIHVDIGFKKFFELKGNDIYNILRFNLKPKYNGFIYPYISTFLGSVENASSLKVLRNIFVEYKKGKYLKGQFFGNESIISEFKEKVLTELLLSLDEEGVRYVMLSIIENSNNLLEETSDDEFLDTLFFKSYFMMNYFIKYHNKILFRDKFYYSKSINGLPRQEINLTQITTREELLRILTMEVLNPDQTIPFPLIKEDVVSGLISKMDITILDDYYILRRFGTNNKFNVTVLRIETDENDIVTKFERVLVLAEEEQKNFTFLDLAHLSVLFFYNNFDDVIISNYRNINRIYVKDSIIDKRYKEINPDFEEKECTVYFDLNKNICMYNSIF